MLMDTSRQDASSQQASVARHVDINSYSAERLQHASPSHLHITTRRCFIGPIPEAWLSRHRKSWYKHRPHLSTYSSRTATFDASANISYSKQLSGLESTAASGHYAGPSFPQPDDVDADESAATLEPTSTREEPSAGAQVRPAKQVDFQIPTVVTSQSAEGETPQEDAVPDQAVSTGRRPSSFSTVGKSFVTAKETLSSTKAPSEHLAESTKLKPIESQDTDLLTISNQQSASSSTSQQQLDANRLRSSIASTSPLLKLHSSDEEPSGTQTPQNNPEYESTAAGVSTEQQTDETSLAPPTQHVGVHFNIVKPPPRERATTQVPLKESLFRGLLHAQTKPGELIKAERMLVRVDWTKHELPPDFMENDSLRIESIVVEKWREFMVVCRKSAAEDDEDDNFVLHMSKTRVLPLIDQQHTSKRSAHSIQLRRRVTRINMYSSLDKSFVLWHSWKKGTRVYVLRPRSSVNAVEWYTFLNTLLGWRRPQNLIIHVPDMNVTLNLDRPFQALKAVQDRLLSSNVSTDGSTFQEAAQQVVAYDIMSRCIAMLEKSPVSETLKTWLTKEVKLGLAWKRYDRLEWVHGANEERMYGSFAMQNTHDLELRPKEHYPTRATNPNGQQKSMDEPSPVEGFLIRLTSQKGRHSRLGKSFFKRLYFSSHDQYLFFSVPGKAVPPKPPKLTEEQDIKSLPKAAKFAEKIPLIYAVNPYPLKDGKIPWLEHDTEDSRKHKDEMAQEEHERQIHTLTQSQGYIDMCQIEQIRRSGGSDTTFLEDETQDRAINSDNDANVQNDEGERQRAKAVAATHVFELSLQNGLVIRLQAYDSLARDEWVKRLRELSRYWKLRTAADIKLFKSVRQENLKRLDIDEEMESTAGQFAQKWEVTKAVASAELFNMCSISCCRSITMSGSLFYKPRLHAKFRRCNAVLCSGKILIFDSTLREQSGKPIPQIHHERLQTVNLQDTYTYSGLATDNDLLYQNQTFDSNHPGHHALPRMYLEDNWTSSDEDTMTCFVVWHGKSRSLFRAMTEQEDGSKRHKLRYVSSLGQPGRSIVFKARSRAERDRWVTSIGVEIERLQQMEDVRVVEKKGYGSPLLPTISIAALG